MNVPKLIFTESFATADLLLVPIYKGTALPRELAKIDALFRGGISLQVEQEGFKAELGELLTVTTNGVYPIPKIVLVGLGEKGASPLAIQEAGAHAALAVKKETLAIDATALEVGLPADFIFGMLVRLWRYKKGLQLQTIQLFCQAKEAVQSSYAAKEILCQGVALARELTAAPANLLNPEIFANRCLELKKEGVKVEVLDEKALKKLGAGGLLGVGQGSIHPPRLVTMHWKGGKKDASTIALVGKGVCYDSGGINIKTSMLLEMKWDKAGAAAVTGTLYTLAKMRVPFNVVGVVGLAENMPDGGSMKPGDVLTTLAGKTVEIVDTDFEGRVVLADCLWYAQEKFGAEVVIDLGTLTPETPGSLAGEYAALYSNEKSLERELLTAGQESGEKTWTLPMGPAFAKQIESAYADMKNMGIPENGENGAAAEFLKCFVKPGVAWAHLDIAGVAWTNEDSLFNEKGVTGYGVRLLTKWLEGSQAVSACTLQRLK